MKILGVCHDVYVCSACLVDDGKVVFAIAEERLDRVKQSRIFPTRAIQECLKHADLELTDVDEIAVAWNPAIEAETALPGYLAGRRWRGEHLHQIPTRFLGLAGEFAARYSSHVNLWDGAPPITYVGHYLSHVGNAVYLSPFEECAVLVLDGRGERTTGLLAHARGIELEILREIEYPHSLGLFYGAFTQFLGFRPDSDEWKIMALASYAEGENEFLEPVQSLIDVDAHGSFRISLDFFQYYNSWDRRMYSDRLVDLLGEPRTPNAEIDHRHYQIAGALQRVFENSVAKIAKRLHESTGQDHLVVTGGCFMNSVLNGKITRLTPFEDCYITGSPDDSGTSVGAALYLWAQRTGKRPDAAITGAFWGNSYSDEECLKSCRRYKLPDAEPVEDPASRAAGDLAAGRLVGWFQGRSEFGQRALGNRSILADPRKAETKEVVNAAVKFREGFRPFAPAILAERVADYFECPPNTSVPFMEKVLPFRQHRRTEVPAVVHVDGSGRLQTVAAGSGSRFRQLIESFADETGVPIVLNTSFNLNGEPVVNSPEDAIRTFYSCGLDVLYLGNVRISKAK